MSEKWQATWWEFFTVTLLSNPGRRRKKMEPLRQHKQTRPQMENDTRSFSPSVVMAAVSKLEMGLNPWPVSSVAFSGLGGTAPDENGARAETYEWLFVWWSDTITNWVTQLTGSQSNAQFDLCMFFFFHFTLPKCILFGFFLLPLRAFSQYLCFNGKINDL